MEYKVEVLTYVIDVPSSTDFERELNRKSEQGWRLHSITPQKNENGIFTLLVYEKSVL